MTKIEFLKAVFAMTSEDNFPEVHKYAGEGIEKDAATKAARKAKPSKTAIANVPIKEAIVSVLREASAPMTAASIGVECEISTAKASYLCGELVREGKAVASKVKQKGKAAVNGYALSVEDEAEAETETEADE